MSSGSRLTNDLNGNLMNQTSIETDKKAPALAISALMKTLFIALFAQLQLILFASLASSKAPLFVSKIRLQVDFEDFYIATADWLHGLDPYARLDQFLYHRFNKPAPVLLLALPLQRFSEHTAAYIFYVANIVAVVFSLWGISRYFRLSRNESLLFFGISSMYLPAIFVIERGNLDGFMLAFIVMSLILKNPFAKGIAQGISVGLKLYTALLLLPLTITRRWKQALALFVVSSALFLSFHSLFMSFIHSQMARSAENYLFENICPAALAGIFTSFGETTLFKLIYLALWFLSYMSVIVRYRKASVERLTIYSLPWMMAFPFLVLPYTGVLLLPVMVLRIREMGARGFLTIYDRMFLAGFFLIGFQPLAMTTYFMWLTHSHQFFYVFNPLGTTLVLCSLTFGPTEERSTYVPTASRLGSEGTAAPSTRTAWS